MNKSNNLSTTNDANEDDKQQENFLEKEKVKVKKQIKDLKTLIEDIELELDITPYGACEIVGKSSSHNDSVPVAHTYQNIYHTLQYEMHKLSGFYCSKVNENEIVVNISPVSSKKSLYAVQISTLNETVQLKGWVLPWGITIDKIIAETPIQKPGDVIPFLRNCKRTVDCYANREEQFEKLKESTSSFNNIKIDATLGYITIYCHLLGMHNKSTDEKFDLMVILNYGTGRTQPMSVNVEWNLKKNISKEMVHIKTFVEFFKTQPLVNAFEDIMKHTHTIYHWNAEKCNNSIMDVLPLDLSAESNSSTEISENENEEYNQKRKKKRHLKKGNTKSSLHKRTIDRQSSQLSLDTTSNSSEQVDLSKYISDPISQQETPPSNENSSGNKKKKPNINLKSKIHKNKRELQQHELNFKGVPVSSRLTGKSKIVKNKGNKPGGKKNMTSTPNAKVHVAQKVRPSMNSLGLSPIQTSINSHE